MEMTKEQEWHVKRSCNKVDVEEMYDDMLDGCYGPVHIGTLEYSASYVLEEVDPIAYRCGMVDYMDSLELVEIDGEYYLPEDVEGALEEFADLQEDSEDEEE